MRRRRCPLPREKVHVPDCAGQASAGRREGGGGFARAGAASTATPASVRPDVVTLSIVPDEHHNYSPKSRVKPLLV